MNKIKFKYLANESPSSKIEHAVLSLQHVFAMFGSTVLVPTLIGIDVSTALLCAGLGTLIYSQVTKKKVPVFIGSSFAYIGILSALNSEAGISSVAMAVISVGVIYLLFSLLIHFVGTKWIDKILPPVVIGPVIIIIGLSLAPTAVNNSGLLLGSDNYGLVNVIIAFTALLSAGYAMLIGTKSMKMIPIIIGIGSGYLVAVLIQLFTDIQIIDFSLIFANGLFSIPEIHLPFISYSLDLDPGIFLSVIPLVLVTLSEHIGDHSISSSMMDEDYLKDPGLSRTILGDGLATLVAGILGGPVNTTYAENTGVIMMTRVASVSVIRLAAVFAVLLAFIGPVVGFINSIPVSVMGGISILLFGMISQNGIRIMVQSNLDFAHPRNLVILSVILVIGLGGGGLAFTIGGVLFTFSGMALAALIGILLHLFLPQKEVSYGEKHIHLN